MGTLAVQITPAGPQAPDFDDILAQLQSQYWGIYGNDAVLTPDTQDGQMLAVFAEAINDCNQTALAVISSFSPTNAQGAMLASLVKINGLRKKVATNSTCIVSVGGTFGTQIFNGQIGDDQGLDTAWNLPPLVTIPNTGTIDVTATCTDPGAVAAAPGTLTKILTPTFGWQSVTNVGAATVGEPIETDPALKARQAVSTAVPASTNLTGIFSQVQNLPGVGRVQPYENDTDAVDQNGLTPHSIAMVVEGGQVADIAAAIQLKKAPGVNTVGTTSLLVLDQAGVPEVISWYALSLVPVTVTVSLRALTGFTTSTETIIQQAVAGFLSSLAIGEDSYASRLYSAANLKGDDAVLATGLSQQQLDALGLTYQIRSITQSRPNNPADTAVTGGPYGAGAAAVNVGSAADIYQGQQVQLTMDNAAALVVTVVGVAGATVSFFPAIPAGRSVLGGSSVFLVSDLLIGFSEAATASVDDVNVLAT